MDDKIQSAGEHMLQGTPGHLGSHQNKGDAGEKLPGRLAVGRGCQPSQFGDRCQGRRDGEEQQKGGQGLKSPAGQSGRAAGPAPAHHQEAARCQGDQPEEKQRAGDTAAPAGPGHENQHQQAGAQPAGRQPMHQAGKPLAGDGVMNIVQIGARQTDDARSPVNPGRPAAGPATCMEIDGGRQHERGKQQAEGDDRHGAISLPSASRRSKPWLSCGSMRLQQDVELRVDLVKDGQRRGTQGLPYKKGISGG